MKIYPRTLIDNVKSISPDGGVITLTDLLKYIGIVNVGTVFSIEEAIDKVPDIYRKPYLLVVYRDLNKAPDANIIIIYFSCAYEDWSSRWNDVTYWNVVKKLHE